MSATVEHTRRQRAAIDGLRELADFLEAHPEVPMGYGMTAVANANAYAEDDEPAIDRLARIARLPGRWDKKSTGDAFHLVRKFGPHQLIVFANREQVCKRVVVGTEMVTRYVPAPDSPPMVPVTELVEKAEWVCPPSLLESAS